MHHPQNPAEQSGEAPGGARENRVVIVVVRSGGFAGLRRRWRVEPDLDQSPQWLALVERCPWEETLDQTQLGADRYVWSIHARLPDAQREQVVPDTLLQGAWRDLVDAVRDADTAENRPSPPGAQT